MSIVLRLCLLLLGVQVASGQPATNAVLTRAADVLSLPGNNAWGREVSLRGVVTAAQPVTATRTNWEGRFFVQDATAGIFAEDSERRQPAPGDYVEVTGISHPGGFAPFISYARWQKLGSAPLPTALPVPIEQLMAGIEDSQRVEITGIVRAFQEDPPLVVYEVASGGYRLRVYAPQPPEVDPQSLVGAQVRVRGTASTFFSGELRQLITVELHVPFASDFVIEKARPDDPFQAPVLPLNSLGQYRRNRELGERVHVQGMVTYQRPGEDLFIQDATSGLQIKSQQREVLSPGDQVEAVGFLEFDRYLPVLADAVFRKTGQPRESLAPKPVAAWELRAGYRHADLIRLQGKVLERLQQRTADENAEAPQRTLLTVQNDGLIFTVEGFAPGPNQALVAIPIGSLVEVDGIGFMHIEEDGELQSLQILLPSASAVRILKKPNWLTPRRLLFGLSLLLAVLMVALSWNVMVHKKNSALNTLLAEKHQAQQELQQSHDLLEARVAERTQQLKIEMTARKETEVQFKATLAERTRLAQELHDTTEQSLTGISLQLDTAARQWGKGGEGARRTLDLVRTLMTRSQLELRRSIWDLRSRELEQFDLPTALRRSAREILEDTAVQADLQTAGVPVPLSEVAEQNLLRIGREALTNVIKHARASHVSLLLTYGPQTVCLQIKDDGCGFSPENAPGSQEGHFGLLGISERAKRFHGKVHLVSAPGHGTCLEVEIPLKATEGTDATATTSAHSQQP